MNPALKAMSKLAAGRSYDVLENHAKFFKQPEKSFQPRIKNHNTESHLKTTSYYNPPRRRARKSAAEPKSGDYDDEFENDYKAMDTNRSNATRSSISARTPKDVNKENLDKSQNVEETEAMKRLEEMENKMRQKETTLKKAMEK